MFSGMGILQTIITTCLFISLAAGAAGAQEPRKKIIAAIPADFPPTYYQDKKTGKAAGFAIDLMDEVARQAGLEVEYVFGHTWAGIQQLVLSGEADVVPNLTVSDDRKKLFIFTSPVESHPVNYIVRSQDKKTVELKPGMNVGVIKGSIAQLHLNTRRDINLQLYENLQHMLFDLLSGRLDMVLTATPNIRKLAMEIGIEDRITALEPPVMEAKRAMALRSDDHELYDRLEEVIKVFAGSEKYKELYKKWWVEPPPYWTVQRVAAMSAGCFAAIVALLWWWSWSTTSRLNRKLEQSLKDKEEERSKLDDAVRSMRSSEQRFRDLFQNISDPVYISDLSGRIIAANDQACLALGYSNEEFLQMRVIDLDGVCVEPEALAEHFKILSEKKAMTFDSVHRRKDGSLLQVEINARIIEFDGQPAVLGVARDITGRKQAEEERLQLEKQLLHGQKLESLGVLAGGIAHDFNNILTSIMGNADLALMRLNPESPAIDNLRRIEQSAARAADLAKQMLAYSGKGKFVIEQIDVNRLVEEMLHMLEVSISKNALLRLNLHQPLPSVEADATQLRQIIMNLIINASEAIGDRSGVIAITTGRMECDQNYLKNAWLDENLDEGEYVYLEITDSGCGMDRGTLAKIFDPFFTTKFTGRGLGMAAVLGIVRGHRGAINVYSEPDKGTTFKVLLPAGGMPAEPFDSEAHDEAWEGSGTVLLVDDEESVRNIGTEMLRELGFMVITADEGRRALEQYQTHPGISLVILDLTMPHMDGEQCFRELKQLDPDAKVVISSGYNEYEVSQRFAGKGLSGFIQKPYRLSALKEAIKAVVTSDSASLGNGAAKGGNG